MTVLYMIACAMSIIFQVKVPYKSGMKSFTVRTPQRKKCIKRITRRSHVSSVFSDQLSFIFQEDYV